MGGATPQAPRPAALFYSFETHPYELKYVIPTSLANTIARDLLDYLDFDNYGDKQGTYVITSLYYDSPDYSAYWDKIEGEEVLYG